MTHFYFLFFILPSIVSAALTYCSHQNTGTSEITDQFQSNGLCSNTCLNEGFALAIVKDYGCYCSNYAPGETDDLSQCNTPCPGFPSEMCGGDNVYGYIYLHEPSDTITQSFTSSTEPTKSSSKTDTSSLNTISSSTMPTTSSSKTDTSSTNTISSSTQQTSSISSSTMSSSISSSSTVISNTSLVLSMSTTVSSSSSSLSLTSISSITTVPPTKSQSASIVTSVIYSLSLLTASKSTEYITSGVTVTLTPSSIIATNSVTGMLRTTGNATTENSHGGFFDQKGKVAGVFTAVGIGSIIFLGFIAWLIWSCYHMTLDEEDDDEEQVVPAAGYPSITRNATIVTAPALRHSPKSKFIAGEDDTSSTEETVINDKRNSHHNSLGNIKNVSLVSTDYGTPIISHIGESTYVDQRLDFGTFTQFNENDEILSLNDNQDYSRKVLKVTNP